MSEFDDYYDEEYLLDEVLSPVRMQQQKMKGSLRQLAQQLKYHREELQIAQRLHAQ